MILSPSLLSQALTEIQYFVQSQKSSHLQFLVCFLLVKRANKVYATVSMLNRKAMVNYANLLKALCHDISSDCY